MSKWTQSVKFDAEVCIHIARRSCEHFALGGAAVDLFATAFRWPWLALALFAKACLLAGACGVLLLHAEEQRRAREKERANAPGKEGVRAV